MVLRKSRQLMHRKRKQPESLPTCYAMVIPGLEEVAAEEVAQELGAEVKRTGPGLVVFRPWEVGRRMLRLRTTEDVFLLAWGTDSLTFRARDLDSIRRWTARDADWQGLLRLHHAIRPKPTGRPTFRLVTQMAGSHGYRRVDAREALARGLEGKLPASWRHAEENAAVEVWLTIHEATAVCGLRLSDRSMRHRTYKEEHRPASLRPTVAAAMVRLAGAHHGEVMVDPMCGAGTILAEQLAVTRRGTIRVLGGDLDVEALRTARANLRPFGEPDLVRWDATLLPLGDHGIDCLISNPPFGKQLGEPDEIGPLYRNMVPEYDRVLRGGGRVVLLTADVGALREAVRDVAWQSHRHLRVRVLGQRATIGVWRKK
jgi:23S rRNA G2445 N2-methylase RlmL